MLGCIDDSDEAAVLAAKWQTWTQKELTRLGIWEDEFDDFTDEEIWSKIGSLDGGV